MTYYAYDFSADVLGDFEIPPPIHTVKGERVFTDVMVYTDKPDPNSWNGDLNTAGITFHGYYFKTIYFVRGDIRISRPSYGA